MPHTPLLSLSPVLSPLSLLLLLLLLLPICSAYLCANVYARSMAPKRQRKTVISVWCSSTSPLYTPELRGGKRHAHMFLESPQQSERHFFLSFFLFFFVDPYCAKENAVIRGAQVGARSPRCQHICLRGSTAHTNWLFHSLFFFLVWWWWDTTGPKTHRSAHQATRGFAVAPSFCGV